MLQISAHNPTPDAFTNEEERAMWQFLRRKLLNVKTGKIEKLEVRSKFELWDEFRSETNGTRRCRDYEKRFDNTMAPNLHKAELGLRTKTELYFGMDIPVESSFQQYLCQIGETEIDKAGCLVKFKEFKRGGLELEMEKQKEIKEEIDTETPIKVEEPDVPEVSQEPESSNAYYERQEIPEVSQEPECSNAYYERHRIAGIPPEQPETSDAYPNRSAANPFTPEEEMDMWIFLLQKLHNPRSGKVEKLRTTSKFALWNEFKKITQSKRRPMDYEKRFAQQMASALHSTDFDTKTKIELYYGLQIPVDPVFLEKIRTRVDIQLNKDNLIEKYTDYEDQLLGCSATVTNFDNINNNEPECSNAYYERERLEKQSVTRQKRNSTSSVISSSKSAMPETRSAYLQRQQSSFINLQNRRSSVYFESEMPLKSEPTRKSKKRTPTPIPTESVVKSPHFTSDEELDMWIFLLQKVRNPDTGKAVKQSVSSNYNLWNEFKTCSNGSKSAKEYLTRFELVMRDYLYLARLTQQMKLELYFGLGLPMEPLLLQELEANADVVLDRKGCLVMYEERRTHGEKFMLGVEEAPKKQPVKQHAKKSIKQELLSEKTSDIQTKFKKKTIKNHVKSEPGSQEDSEAETSIISEYEPLFDRISIHEDSYTSYIHHRSANKRQKMISSSDDSEGEYTRKVVKKPKRKPSTRKVSSDSEDEEREHFVPEPPKFVREPITEKSYEGPFIQKTVYLNILKNVLTKIEQSEQFTDLRKIIEEKIENCEEDKLISVGFMKHLIDSIFATSLYS